MKVTDVKSNKELQELGSYLVEEYNAFCNRSHWGRTTKM